MRRNDDDDAVVLDVSCSNDNAGDVIVLKIIAEIKVIFLPLTRKTNLNEMASSHSIVLPQMPSALVTFALLHPALPHLFQISII